MITKRSTAVFGTLRAHPVVGYFSLSLLFSWAIWVPMALYGARVLQGQPWPNHLAGLLGPIVSAFAMTAVVSGRSGIRNLVSRMVLWRIAPGWYLVALSPLAFFVVAAAGMRLAGQGWPNLTELGRFSSLPVVAAPVMWLLLLVAGMAEETGWRGFAVPELQKTHGLLTTALVIGVVWAAWHLPSMLVIQNYRDLGLAVLPGFAIGIVAGSILLAWLYNASGGSILIVSVWHATFNLVSGTAAAHGTVAAVVTSAVMAWAVVIVVLELLKARRSRRFLTRQRPSARGTVSLTHHHGLESAAQPTRSRAGQDPRRPPRRGLDSVEQKSAPRGERPLLAQSIPQHRSAEGATHEQPTV